jgi:hypothetical protein
MFYLTRVVSIDSYPIRLICIDTFNCLKPPLIATETGNGPPTESDCADKIN